MSTFKESTSSPLSLNDSKQTIDDMLRRLFAERREGALAVGSQYDLLWQFIEKAAMAGGKRIRPYLTAMVEGNGDARVWPVAAAQELIHIAMLIHDDIIDQDFVRHGQENVNGAYRRIYGAHLDDGRATHYANGSALLAGDALIAEAFRMLYGSDYDEDIKRQLLDQLSQSIFEVIGGELLDVEAGFDLTQPTDPIRIARYKTASYSFIGPIVSGALAASLEAEDIKSLRSFAENAGIAYQIQDDLLGIFGDESKTGKSTLTDLREGKRTLLIEDYMNSAGPEQRRRFEKVFGATDASEGELAWAKNDIEASGAKARTAAVSGDYFDRALHDLASLPPGARRAGLEQFTHALRSRVF